MKQVKMEEEGADLDSFLATPWARDAAARGSQERRRKRKKRRKSKVPKTSSFLSSRCTVPRQGRRHPRRGAEAVSLGPALKRTEFLHLQFIDCSMSVGRSSIFGCRLGEDSRDPTVATRHVRAWTRSFTRPLCATTDAWWFSVQKTAMYRSCCSVVCVELIVVSCQRSRKSCRCPACSIG